MKTLTAILIAIVLAAGLFAAGLRLGYHQRDNIKFYATLLVDRRLGDATGKAEILHLMDLGKYSDARNILQGQFNLDILEVISLENDSDIRKQEFTRRICAKIVAYRNEFPSNYVSNPAFGQAWTEEEVNSYLKKTAVVQAK